MTTTAPPFVVNGVPLRFRVADRIREAFDQRSTSTDPQEYMTDTWLTAADVALAEISAKGAEPVAAFADRVYERGMSAFCDPGAFVTRGREDDGYEPLFDWQKRALRELLNQLLSEARGA